MTEPSSQTPAASQQSAAGSSLPPLLTPSFSDDMIAVSICVAAFPHVCHYLSSQLR